MSTPDTPKRTAKRTASRRLANRMRRHGWLGDDDALRTRVYRIVSDYRGRWWDWGHPVMTLVGSGWGGNYQEPTPPTWWYRTETSPRRMWRTGYPRTRLRVVKDYDAFRDATEGLQSDSDEHYPWRAICTSQDNDLHLGRQYWGGDFYGLSFAEMRLLTIWLIRWEFTNWFGLRSWIYTQALHAAVHQRKPFTCQQTPPKGSGGYTHWHCQLKRNHTGPHRFNNYTWSPADREVIYDGATS